MKELKSLELLKNHLIRDLIQAANSKGIEDYIECLETVRRTMEVSKLTENSLYEFVCSEIKDLNNDNENISECIYKLSVLEMEWYARDSNTVRTILKDTLDFREMDKVLYDKIYG